MINIAMNESPPVSLAQTPQTVQTAQGIRHQSQDRGGIVLKKGQKTTLTAAGGSHPDVMKAGLWWDASPGYDLDVECFMLGAEGKVPGDNWFVFYGNLQSPDGAVQHSGDCRDGSLPGDDEVITIKLSAVDPRVMKLVFVVTINQARELGLDFSGVRNAGIHLQDCASGRDLCSFQLTGYYADVASVVAGEIYRYNGQWKFNPAGDGLAADLYGLCTRYGVNVRG